MTRHQSILISSINALKKGKKSWQWLIDINF